MRYKKGAALGTLDAGVRVRRRRICANALCEKTEMIAGIVLRARWETARRWYEAELGQDLLGDWVVMRRWGGKGLRRHGEKPDVVHSQADGHDLIEQIHQTRLRRKPPYWRVY